MVSSRPWQGFACIAAVLLGAAAETAAVPEAPAPSGADPLVAAMTAPMPVESCEPIIPCTDPAGCPDLVVDRRALVLRYVETRTFDASTCAVREGLIQAGTRRLLRFGTLTPNIGEGGIVIGRPEDHPQWFEFNTCHGHGHFGEYADDRLWTLPAYLRWIAGRAARCWADYYRPALDGQWIDVTGLPGGFYVFETEVNPARRFTEMDYGNNAAAVLITLPPP